MKLLLWLVNGGLAAAIMFAGVALVTPAEPVRLPVVDIERPPEKPPTPSGLWMRDARNPIEPGVARPDPHITVELMGTNAPADRAWGWAYLLVAGRHPVTAFLGEAVPEMAGWILTKVTPSSATLSNGERDVTINVAESLSPKSPERKVTLLQRTNDREVYAVDRAFATWAEKNLAEALSGIGLSDYASGGIQITSLAGTSLGADLGFREGDVIKAVNGQPVASAASLTDLKTVGATMIVVSFERAGATRTVVLQASR